MDFNLNLVKTKNIFPGKLLDLDCGEGLFLELASKDGWDI